MVPKFGGVVSMFMRLMTVARHRFIVELIAIFVAVWCGCAMLIYAFEIGLNPLIHSRLETIYLLLVTMTTSGDSAVKPLTPGGRMVMSLALILSKLLTALLCALAAAVLIDRKLKVEMGLKMHKLENHIVLVGWNLKGAQIITTLRSEARHHTTAILVMADIDQKPVDDPLVYFTRSVFPIRGESIERACLSTASVIVVLANYAERHHADALSTVNCLLARKVNPKARIIAELLDPSQRPYLEAAGADAVISIGDVGGFLMAEAVLGSQQAQQLLNYVARRTDNGGEEAAVET